MGDFSHKSNNILLNVLTFNNNTKLFTTFSTIASIAHITIGLLVAWFETKFISCWIGFCLLVAGIVNMAVLKKSFRGTKLYGNLLGVFTHCGFGHCLASIFCLSPLFTRGKPFIYQITPIGLFVASVMMMHLAFWHKHSVRDDEFEENLCGVSLWRYYTFKYTLGLLISLVIGLTEPRIQHGAVPCSYFEGFFGLATAGFLLSLLRYRFRHSYKGCVALLIWTWLSAAHLFQTSIYYYMKATTRSLHIQYGLSLVIALTIFFIMLITVILKCAILEEPIIFLDLQKNLNTLKDDNVNLKEISISTSETIVFTRS